MTESIPLSLYRQNFHKRLFRKYARSGRYRPRSFQFISTFSRARSGPQKTLMNIYFQFMARFHEIRMCRAGKTGRGSHITPVARYFSPFDKPATVPDTRMLRMRPVRSGTPGERPGPSALDPAKRATWSPVLDHHIQKNDSFPPGILSKTNIPVPASPGTIPPARGSGRGFFQEPGARILHFFTSVQNRVSNARVTGHPLPAIEDLSRALPAFTSLLKKPKRADPARIRGGYRYFFPPGIRTVPGDRSHTGEVSPVSGSSRKARTENAPEPMPAIRPMPGYRHREDEQDFGVSPLRSDLLQMPGNTGSVRNPPGSRTFFSPGVRTFFRNRPQKSRTLLLSGSPHDARMDSDPVIPVLTKMGGYRSVPPGDNAGIFPLRSATRQTMGYQYSSQIFRDSRNFFSPGIRTILRDRAQKNRTLLLSGSPFNVHAEPAHGRIPLDRPITGYQQVPAGSVSGVFPLRSATRQTPGYHFSYQVFRDNRYFFTPGIRTILRDRAEENQVRSVSGSRIHTRIENVPDTRHVPAGEVAYRSVPVKGIAGVLPLSSASPRQPGNYYVSPVFRDNRNFITPGIRTILRDGVGESQVRSVFGSPVHTRIGNVPDTRHVHTGKAAYRSVPVEGIAGILPLSSASPRQPGNYYVSPVFRDNRNFITPGIRTILRDGVGESQVRSISGSPVHTRIGNGPDTRQVPYGKAGYRSVPVKGIAGVFPRRSAPSPAPGNYYASQVFRDNSYFFTPGIRTILRDGAAGNQVRSISGSPVHTRIGDVPDTRQIPAGKAGYRSAPVKGISEGLPLRSASLTLPGISYSSQVLRDNRHFFSPGIRTIHRDGTVGSRSSSPFGSLVPAWGENAPERIPVSHPVTGDRPLPHGGVFGISPMNSATPRLPGNTYSSQIFRDNRYFFSPGVRTIPGTLPEKIRKISLSGSPVPARSDKGTVLISVHTGKADYRSVPVKGISGVLPLRSASLPLPGTYYSSQVPRDNRHFFSPAVRTILRDNLQESRILSLSGSSDPGRITRGPEPTPINQPVYGLRQRSRNAKAGVSPLRSAIPPLPGTSYSSQVLRDNRYFISPAIRSVLRDILKNDRGHSLSGSPDQGPVGNPAMPMPTSPGTAGSRSIPSGISPSSPMRPATLPLPGNYPSLQVLQNNRYFFSTGVRTSLHDRAGKSRTLSLPGSLHDPWGENVTGMRPGYRRLDGVLHKHREEVTGASQLRTAILQMPASNYSAHRHAGNRYSGSPEIRTILRDRTKTGRTLPVSGSPAGHGGNTLGPALTYRQMPGYRDTDGATVPPAPRLRITSRFTPANNYITHISLGDRYSISPAVRTVLHHRPQKSGMALSYKPPHDSQPGNRSELTFYSHQQINGSIDTLKKELVAIRSRTESDLASIRQNYHSLSVSETEMHRIATNVVRTIEDRLSIERERRGYF